MRPEHVPFVFPIQLGSPSADDSIVAGAYFYAHRKCVITSAVVIDGAGIVADNSNYVQLELLNGADVVAELDSRAAHENALVVDVAKAMNISSTYEEIAAGDTLTVNYQETGTVAMTNAMIQIAGYWVETV
jgi:hypothetical protein